MSARPFFAAGSPKVVGIFFRGGKSDLTSITPVSRLRSRVSQAHVLGRLPVIV